MNKSWDELTIFWSICPKFGGSEKKCWDKLTKIWSIRPKLSGRIVLSWDKLTKVGQIDLKLERTDQNWDELVWDKLDLERIDLYPVQQQKWRAINFCTICVDWEIDNRTFCRYWNLKKLGLKPEDIETVQCHTKDKIHVIRRALSFPGSIVGISRIYFRFNQES